MKVETLHRDVERMKPIWQVVDDCVAGSAAVKKAAEKYLPMLAWKKDRARRYEAYKQRALFEEAIGRTWEALVGTVMSVPPDVAVPAWFKPRLGDITLSGIPFQAFARTILGEVLAPGRCGVLVDVGRGEPGTAEVLEPYADWYCASHVEDWDYSRRRGRMVLTYLKLREEFRVRDPNDRFVSRYVQQRRVIDLVDGAMVHEIWRTNAADEWIKVDEIMPLRGNEPVPFIPFTFFNPQSITAEVEDAPLYGLAEINLSQYRTSADLEHGRHFTGLPTPYAFGAGTKDGLEIGSSTVWTSDNPEAKAGYVEFTGQGLASLERAMEEKREQMAAHGARLLLPPKTFPESEMKARLDRAGEQSILASIAGTVGLGLAEVLSFMAWWHPGRSDSIEDIRKQITVKLNTEFDRQPLTPEQGLALMQWWQGAAHGPGMSRSTYLWNLARGGALPPGRTPEEEAELMEQEAPRADPISLD